MRIIKKYKKAICDVLGEENVRNFRIEKTEDRESNIMFETTTAIGIEKTCVLRINTKRNSSIEILEFINEEFIKEFSRLTEGGTLESELEEADPQENCSRYLNCGCDCEDGTCNDDDDSIDSVAESLGFYIDDDGHWIPNDDDYRNNWSEDLEPCESYRELPDGSIEFVDEYSSFKFTYKDEEEAKNYIKN